MVRLYKTKNLRAQWSEEDAGIAVAAVEGGMSLKKAAKDYNVPRTSLRRKLKLKRCVSSMKTCFGSSNNFKAATRGGISADSAGPAVLSGQR